MLALLLIAAQAAEPSPSPPPRFAEEVVVTAERGASARAETPAAVSVMSGDEARLLPVVDLAGVLDHMPGFQVLFSEGYGQAPMVLARGFFGAGEAEYVQLLVDGVPAADAETGLADWRRLRAADVARVEAVRGPASPLYGDTALGGVVQVFTRHGPGAEGGSASLSAATFRSASGEGAWRGAAGPLGMGLEATASRTDGFRAHGGEDGGGVSVRLSGAGPAPRVVVTLTGSTRGREDPGPLTAQQAQLSPSASDPLFRFDRDDSRRGRVAVAVRGGGWLDYRAQAHASFRDAEVVRTLLLAPGLGDRARRDVDTRGAGVILEGERDAGAVAHLRLGLEATREDVDSVYRAVGDAGRAGGVTGSVEARRDRAAAFASADWRTSERVRLVAGARFDAIADDAGPALGGRRTRTAWSPQAGATVRLGRLHGIPVTVFVHASRAFKAPTIDQLADARPFPDFAGGTFTVSNPLLEPQRAGTVEAGVSRAGPGGRVEVVAYRTAVDDEIDFDPATFRYANVGRSLHRGIEASLELFERRAVSPRVSYAWTDVHLRGEGVAAGQLKNIPVHTVRAGATARLPGHVGLDARVGWMGRRFADDAEQVPLRDALVVDARATRAFGRMRLRLDATNLIGRRWDALGYVLSDFEGRAVPHVFPAAGRALRAGIDYNF